MKVKLLKYPKKPKTSASIGTIERYLEKVKAVDKENNARKTAEKKRNDLLNKARKLTGK